MNDDSNRQQNEQHPHASRIATTRQRSRNQTCKPPRPRFQPPRWALVQVSNGAVLATFTEEARAREAISTADDDEVVILYVGA